MADEARERNAIQVIGRAAEILRALQDEPTGLSLSEIATRVDLPRSTVQRIVGALLEEQFLMGASLKARVRLGPALLRLAAAASMDVEKVARPYLRSLASEVGETVDLSVLKGSSAIFVEQVLGSNRLIAASAIDDAFPLHCCANGKALLARLSKERRDYILPARLERLTQNTIMDRDALEIELAEVRRTGLAFDLEEHHEGICAVGAAFDDPFGRGYALSIPAPAQRFHDKREVLAARLRETRDLIVSEISGHVVEK